MLTATWRQLQRRAKAELVKRTQNVREIRVARAISLATIFWTQSIIKFTDPSSDRRLRFAADPPYPLFPIPLDRMLNTVQVATHYESVSSLFSLFTINFVRAKNEHWTSGWLLWLFHDHHSEVFRYVAASRA